MKLLILIDHSNHSINNSIYAIANTLHIHHEVHEVWIASKGDHRNSDFFNHPSQRVLSAFKVRDRFEFPFDQYIESTGVHELDYFDAIFLRLPPDKDSFFLHKLDSLFDGSHIVNQPEGIIKTGTKEYILNFQKYTAPIAKIESLDEVFNFKEKYDDIILKPLRSYGGTGIYRINEEGFQLEGNLIRQEDFYKQFENRTQDFLGMRFLKNVVNGDKRIVVAFGRILSYRLRMPEVGSWICNVSRGATDVPTEVSNRELDIIADISPELSKAGIFLYGLDTLENDDGTRIISEINTTSVGGIAPFEKSTGIPSSKILADLLIDHFIQIL